MCGAPAVTDDGIDILGFDNRHFSLGSLNLNTEFVCVCVCGPYYSLVLKHVLGSQLQLCVSGDRLSQLHQHECIQSRGCVFTSQMA